MPRLEPWSIGHSERSGLKVMRHARWTWGQADQSYGFRDYKQTS